MITIDDLWQDFEANGLQLKTLMTEEELSVARRGFYGGVTSILMELQDSKNLALDSKRVRERVWKQEIAEFAANLLRED